MSQEILRKIKSCALEKPFVFISYSAVDKDIVYKDVYELQLRGWNIWLDEKNLDKSNPSWTDDALKAIEGMYCELGILYVSKNSLCSENCYREMSHTNAEETKRYHFNKQVKFIAVEVENIGDIVKYGEKISERLKNSDIPYEERQSRMRYLSMFIGEHFNENNERVRIKPCNMFPDEEDYYNAIEEQFAKSGVKRTETNNYPRIKKYRQAIREMNSAKTEKSFLAAANMFKEFIETFSEEEQKRKQEGELGFYEELVDALNRERQCRVKATTIRNDAIYTQAVKAKDKGTLEGYSDALALFESIKEWNNARKEALDCQKKIYQLATGLLSQARTEASYNKAAEAYECLKDYSDSIAKAKECREKAETSRKDLIYAKALSDMQSNTMEGYEKAISGFMSIYEWKDSAKKVEQLQDLLKALNETDYSKAIKDMSNAKTYQDYANLAERFSSFNGHRESRQLSAHCKSLSENMKRNRKANIFHIFLEVALVIAIVFVYMTMKNVKPIDTDPTNVPSSSQSENVEPTKETHSNNEGNEVEDTVEKAREELIQLLSSAKVGDTVPFGRYEQDNDESMTDEPIEWIVLAKEEDGTLFLISKYGLDVKAFDDSDNTWKDSDLYGWLNNEEGKDGEETFYSTAFDEWEKSLMKPVAEGDNKGDKVFLLSLEEAGNTDYFKNDESRKCKPTAYARRQGAWTSDEGYCWWWLRSPGDASDGAATWTTMARSTSSTAVGFTTVTVPFAPA